MPYNYLTNALVAAPGGGVMGPALGGGGALGAISGILSGIAGGMAGNALTNPLTGGSLGIPFIDIAPSGGAAIFEPYRQSGGGYRAQNFIAPDPGTGALRWFGPLGKPLLWSRDLSAVRRVRKLAGRARRVAGGR